MMQSGTGDAPRVQATARPSTVVRILLRVLSGIGGTILFAVAAILTVGTALAAPLGMLLMRRRAVRLHRQPSRVASFVGAVIASSAAASLKLAGGHREIGRASCREGGRFASGVRVSVRRRR